MMHDHDRDRFHLEMATYLGADPDVAAEATITEISRLVALRDSGALAAALAQAEGLAVACLAFLSVEVGRDDVALALSREAARCRRLAVRDAAVGRAFGGSDAR